MSPGSRTISAASGIEFDETVAIAGTDILVNIAFPVANVKSFYIVSDKDLTLETNNSAAPINTIALKANVPYHWVAADSYDTFKLTADVTKFYFTNASGALATVRCRVIYDPTP